MDILQGLILWPMQSQMRPIWWLLGVKSSYQSQNCDLILLKHHLSPVNANKYSICPKFEPCTVIPDWHLRKWIMFMCIPMQQFRFTMIKFIVRLVLGCHYLTLSLPSSKSTFSQPLKEKCISEVVRIGSITIFRLSELWKAMFFILCEVIFLMRPQGKFDIDHSRECLPLLVDVDITCSFQVLDPSPVHAACGPNTCLWGE